jgi:hypothetical protein
MSADLPPDEDLDAKNRTTCEFDAMCANPAANWTSLFGYFYPVCAEHLTEAVSI